jgi:small-conductance mechanosensitive channel
MNIQYSNWQAVFFDFLVGGIVILSLFRLIHYALQVLPSRSGRFKALQRSLPVVETIVWLLYFSWYTFRFAEIRSVYAFVVIAILFVLFFWISRYYVKDLIAGIMFRASGRFREGEVIIHENLKGTIKQFRLQGIEIESQDGQIIYISYSALVDSPAIKHESTEKSAAYTFTLLTPADLSREDKTQTIEQFLLSLPWSSSHKDPVVTVREKQEDQFLIEVTAYPIEKSYGKKIEQMAVQHFRESV